MKLLNKRKKYLALIENLVHTDKHSSKNELTIASRFYFLVSQDKTRFPLVLQET